MGEREENKGEGVMERTSKSKASDLRESKNPLNLLVSFVWHHKKHVYSLSGRVTTLVLTECYVESHLA